MRNPRPQTHANLHANLTPEISLEVPVGNEKSKTEEQLPSWLAGLESETPERIAAFHEWLKEGSGGELQKRGEDKKLQ